MEYFEKLEYTVDLARLKIEAPVLLWDSVKKKYQQQVSLQTDGTGDWQSSTGSRPDQDESKWNIIHPDLAGTWWEDFFKSLPMKVYRSRLMFMVPRTCYSIHTDAGPRLHIAIKTDKQSRFIFIDPPKIIHIPEDGHIWWVDTRLPHTAINGSLEHRIHLVMCLKDDEGYDEN